MSKVLRPSIITACNSPTFFKRWFRDPATFAAWFVFIKALFALPMDAGEMEIYTSCTQRTEVPTQEVNEASLIVGRRGGKSLILAVIAVYLATFREYGEYLVPGESAGIIILATDRRQARVIFRYCRALLAEVPALAGLIDKEDAETLVLTNGLVIEVVTASFRSVRGYTIIAALADECAFWRSDESANPDAEILAAIRPSMSTIVGAKLLLASSPYARKGVLFQSFKDHFGKNGDPVLVWKAPTRVMNPTVPESVIAEAEERDPANAAAEYGAEFRSDIESFVSEQVINAVTIPNRIELPRVASAPYGYQAFIDAAGGSGQDSMCLGIAHFQDGIGVLDAVRERRPPFSPDDVVSEFSDLMKSYSIYKAESDRWGGDWVIQAFGKQDITVEPCAKPKSDLYRELLPLLNSGKVELLDLKRLRTQLATLERRTARGGRDSIDHCAGGHDDVANVAAGVLVLVAGRPDWISTWLKLGGP